MRQNAWLRIFLLTVIFFFNIGCIVAQQADALDPGFNPADKGFGFGDGADKDLNTVLLQPDGKILIGGNFTRYNQIPSYYFARLHTDGTLDTSFLSSGVNGHVYTLAIQPDGKIIVAGNFSGINGALRNRIARLHPDGTLDLSFNANLNDKVFSVAVQADGKILVGGNFWMCNGVARNRLTRLNSDGTLDASFTIGTGLNGPVQTIVVQVDGKIITGGGFGLYNYLPHGRIARLNTDGSIDAAFNANMGSMVYTAAIQPDGKIVIGGDFLNYNGTVGRGHIARLNADGTLDMGFSTYTGVTGASIGGSSYSHVYSLGIQPDGKIIIGGDFTTFDSTIPRSGIARLNTDGTLDTGFNPGTGVNKLIKCVALQPDGKVVCVGELTRYNGATSQHITRINTNGTLDTSFNPVSGANGHVLTSALQSDGKILIGGGFTSYNNAIRKRIARLNSDGTLDTTFTAALSWTDKSFLGVDDDHVSAIAVQTDGKIIVSGSFYTYSNIYSFNIARLNTDGSLDSSFIHGVGAESGYVKTIAIQPDGKIIIAGDFGFYNGINRSRIARLNTDGTLDLSFNPGQGANETIYCSAIQPDGKIIIAGELSNFNGISRNGIARLNTDGSLDASFNPGTGISTSLYYIQTLVVRPNGNIIIGGNFSYFGGVPRKNIASLNSDGTLDLSFVPNLGLSLTVRAIVLQTDGKLVIGRNFNSSPGIYQSQLMRLNSDGSTDLSFINAGIGANSTISTAILQPDGKIIIGGHFTSFHGIGRNRLIRVQGSPAIGISTSFNSGTSLCAGGQVSVQFSLNNSSALLPGNIFTAQLSDAFGSFSSPVAIGSLVDTISGTINAVIPTGTPAGSSYRIRVIASAPAFIGTDNGTDLIINAQPVVTASASSATICQGEAVILTASGAVSYLWSNGQTGDSITLSPTASTVYTVTGTSAQGCRVADSVTIVVKTSPTLPSVSVNANCEGESIYFVTLPDTSIISYNWTGPAGFTSSMPHPVIPDAMSANSGTYSLTVTNAAGCSSQNSISVAVRLLPDSTFTVSGSGDTYTFTANGTGTYSWTFPGGTPATSTAQSVTVTYSGQGSYQAKLSVTGSNSCSAASTQLVSILGSEESLMQGVLEVWPNPGRGEFNVRLPEKGVVLAEVWDAQGKCVKQVILRDGLLDLRGQAAGLYLLRVQAGSRSYQAQLRVE